LFSNASYIIWYGNCFDLVEDFKPVVLIASASGLNAQTTILAKLLRVKKYDKYKN